MMIDAEGFSAGTAGGLSDHVVMKESHAIRLPDTFPLDVGGNNYTHTQILQG